MSFSFPFCISALLLIACSKPADMQQVPPPSVDTTAVIAGKTYLALGDSYTIGQSVPVADRFPVQLVSMLNASGYKVAPPEIIATTGWTTGNLLDAVKTVPTSKTYDVVSLLIGVNNQYQRRTLSEYGDQFTVLLTKAIEFAGNNPSRVVVISIPDYSVTPYAEGSDKQLIASQIDAFNKVNKEISAAYKVSYIDVTPESRKAASDPSLVANDGLHFSGKEYKVWADCFYLYLKIF